MTNVPTYVLHFKHSSNRAWMESAKPNKPIPVLVIPEGDETAAPIRATGMRVGTEFRVVVPTPDSEQDFVWTWEFLLEALRTYRN
jgi:hypothetical protein